MHRLMGWLTLLVAVIGLSSAASAATLADQGYVNLGGLDLTRWCQHQFGADFKAVAHGNGAGDWSCQRNDNDRREISVTDACRYEYGVPNARSEALGGAGSWRCWKPGQAQKGVDLDAWCKHQYGSSFSAKVRGSKATDWVCEDTRQVSVKDACVLEYGGSVTAAKALNPNDPTSWVCVF